jgi:hypothetical protein
MSSAQPRFSRSLPRRSPWKTAAFVLLALAVAALIGFVASRGDREAAQAPATPAAPSALKTTGNYAEDWQSLCGPLQGGAQGECTTRLDAAYGRSADAPVPPVK